MADLDTENFARLWDTQSFALALDDIGDEMPFMPNGVMRTKFLHA